MGWSCSMKAGKVLEALPPGDKAFGSNSIVVDGKEVGFFEHSNREHRDGSITGSVFRFVSKGMVVKAGAFKISGDGKIVRFPLLSKEKREAAEKSAVDAMARWPGLTVYVQPRSAL